VTTLLQSTRVPVQRRVPHGILMVIVLCEDSEFAQFAEQMGIGTRMIRDLYPQAALLDDAGDLLESQERPPRHEGY
jgi:hypothetical protein